MSCHRLSPHLLTYLLNTGTINTVAVQDAEVLRTIAPFNVNSCSRSSCMWLTQCYCDFLLKCEVAAWPSSNSIITLQCDKHTIWYADRWKTWDLRISRRRVSKDGGSKHHWNVGKHLPDYTMQQPIWPSASDEKSTCKCIMNFCNFRITNMVTQRNFRLCPKIFGQWNSILEETAYRNITDNLLAYEGRSTL
jgi:hypothetical protein